MRLVQKISIYGEKYLQIETQQVDDRTDLVLQATLNLIDLENETIQKALYELGWMKRAKETEVVQIPTS